MEKKKGFFLEWRIENFSKWSPEVHRNCIKSPKSSVKYLEYLELYPKGVDGQGEKLVVRLLNTETCPYYCGLSFLSTDGSQFYPQKLYWVKEKGKELDLPPGPKLEDVFSRIRHNDDVLIVRLFIKDSTYREQHMCTTINNKAWNLSLKLNSPLFEEIDAKGRKNLILVHVPPDCDYIGLRLACNSDNNVFRFSIEPYNAIECPIAVEMCMRTLNIFGETDTCVKEDHLFRDKTVWTFRHSLAKKLLVQKTFCVRLDLKIKSSYVIQNPYYFKYDSRMVSVDLSNNNSYSNDRDRSSTFSEISNQAEDSLTALTTDLMCLYQDQKCSDLTLLCGDVTFPVHSSILSARSPAFWTKLSTEMKKSVFYRMDITDLDPSTLSHFLTFLYTGVVGEEGLQRESALNLYSAADKYQVPSLRRECADFLSANVSISNVCDVLSLADKHQDLVLTSVARDFIVKNYNEVLSSSEWNNFMRNEPLLAVRTLTSFAMDDRLSEIDNEKLNIKKLNSIG